jgi:hypothetical protein
MPFLVSESVRPPNSDPPSTGSGPFQTHLPKLLLAVCLLCAIGGERNRWRSVI